MQDRRPDQDLTLSFDRAKAREHIVAVRLEEITIARIVHAGVSCKCTATQFAVVTKPGLRVFTLENAVGRSSYQRTKPTLVRPSSRYQVLRRSSKLVVWHSRKCSIATTLWSTFIPSTAESRIKEVLDHDD